MAETTIEVQRRESVGKSETRRLRRAEMIPAVLYGAGKESVPIQVPRRTLLELFKNGGHENRIFKLKLLGTDQSRHAMVRDLQIDPVTSQVVHLDFQRIQLDETIRVKVRVEIEGVPLGVKNEGGILDFVTRELEVECLPTAIPQGISVSVADLQIGDHVEASSLELPKGVTYVGAPETVIVSVKHPRVEAEPAVEEAEVEVADESAEPEIIQKGKKEEAEES